MTALVILAAGESGRMGQPKQNLNFAGKTLLQRAVETAIESACAPVMVVLGANAPIIAPTLNYMGISIIQNHSWKEGMASSIRAALAVVTANAVINSVLFMLCDQPFVSVELIDNMLKMQAETGKSIVACTYNNTMGVPMLFSKNLFNHLLLLQGQEGAKKLITDFYDDVAYLPFDKGAVDIDTMKDYEQLLKGNR